MLVDTGGYFNQDATVKLIRQFSPERVNTAIYTHGHVDHACGMPAIVADAQKKNVARPRVVGHRAVAARFDRYKRTAGYNNVVNTRQFNRPASWPTEYVYPDTYFDNQLNVVAGDDKFECHHARGETDDHCWVFIPQRKLLCTGDLIIWAAPNAGNPQKAQRYAREWAEALRVMARLGAEVLVPGHGYPVFGAIRVRQVLNDTAELSAEPVRSDDCDDERGRHARRDNSHREAAGKSRGKAVAASRCTTSPNLSCATSGGWKADGTTARRRISSPRATASGRARSRTLAGGVAPLIARANAKAGSRRSRAGVSSGRIGQWRRRRTTNRRMKRG